MHFEMICVATTVFSNCFLPRTIVKATRHFVSYDVKRNVTKWKQSNFDNFACDRINDAWEVRTDSRSIGIDAAPIILAKKLTRLCLFECVCITTILGVDERRAMLCNELLGRDFKALAQACNVIRRQPDDIEITTPRKRTVSAQKCRRIVCSKIAFKLSLGRQCEVPSPFAFTDDFVNSAAYAFDSASIRRGKPLVHLRSQREP